MSSVINKTCERCGCENGNVGTDTCTEGNEVTTWTCVRCKHPVWSCETDPFAPCRH